MTLDPRTNRNRVAATSRRSGKCIAWFVCGSIVLCLPLTGTHARRYPITESDATGTWIGTRTGLLNGLGELWNVYGLNKGLPSNIVTDLALSTRDVWVSTPKGLARMNKGSRRWETFVTPSLPHSHVTGVSIDRSDPDQVWVSTLGGVAHYNLRTNRWTHHTSKSGLPSDRVNDVLFRGRTVWVATDAGLAAFDLKLKTWKLFTKADGLASDKVIQIDLSGPYLWLTSDKGLARMNLQRRTFITMGPNQGLPGTEIVAQASILDSMFIATDKGIIVFRKSAETLTPFVYAEGLLKAEVRSLVTAGGFVWFATNRGLARFDAKKRVWEYYRVEDGLSSEDLNLITVVGNRLLVFGTQGELDTYDYQRDEWVDRTALLETVGETPQSQPATSQPMGEGAADTAKPAGQDTGKPKRLVLATSGELDTELKQDLTFPKGGDMQREGYWLVNTIRLGVGAQWPSGRKLDVAGNLNWGDISPLFDGDFGTLKSFQRYDLELRYLGLTSDFLQEVMLSDELRLQPAGGRLTESTEIEGGRVVVAAGPARSSERRLATVKGSAGLRRGTPARNVFKRPEIGSLQIKRFQLLKYDKQGNPKEARLVIPSTVRAMLDGRELERNVDFFVDHDNGVLWIKNTDLINMMKILEVEFEYQQIPQKNVGAVSMADLSPRDGDIGQLARSGQARWARDEQGLYDEIDGGADQFINRGWNKTLSQDFEWSDAGVMLRIYDMGDENNAESIFLARRLPDARPVPVLDGVFIEQQTSSLTVKMTRGSYYIEISIDQATMEQEILSIAGWLVSKLDSAGSTSADRLRDVVTNTGVELQLTDNMRLGFNYLGTISVEDLELQQREGLVRTAEDVFALYAAGRHKLGKTFVLATRVQSAASMSAQQGTGRQNGAAVLGDIQLTSPRLVIQAAGRKYSDHYGGIGIARQSEFCRTADRTCRMPGTSRLAHEVTAGATIRAATWLPLRLHWQQQLTKLGDDYDDAPQERERKGQRDVVGANLAFDMANLPKLSIGGSFMRREDAFFSQDRWMTTGTLEADMAGNVLKALRFKRIYLRGLYEYGFGSIDEFRQEASQERDRDESMHHAVGEVSLSPTITENAYAQLELHDLKGALNGNGKVVDKLTYWRVDTGAGSMWVPGISARFDATLWFGDDQPLMDPTLDENGSRSQQANSRLSGILDLLFGEWFDPLSPLRANTSYTYVKQTAAEAARATNTRIPFGEEKCEITGDEDGDGLADCDDPDCALADVCLLRTGQTKAHRFFGTLSWNTPGKLQVEAFGDVQWTYSEQDDTLRATSQEMRTFVNWRPVYPSQLMFRFDLLHEIKWPEQYDGIDPLVEPESWTMTPAFEWRRRWSARWWHVAKLSLPHHRIRGLPHIRTIEDAFGRQGDLERLDYNNWSVEPSLEIRRRFEDESGRWNFRPYVRMAYDFQLGQGISSTIDGQVCRPGDPCLSDGSETSHLFSLSLGLIWVYAENIYVDLDLSGGYYHCVRAATGGKCQDRFTLSPHLFTTARF